MRRRHPKWAVVELVGGPQDGRFAQVALSEIGGGNILWIDGAPYWCETDPIDDDHHALWYPKAREREPS